MEGNGSNCDSDDSSNLDHALLESLFYNEMLMMDDSAEPVLATDFSLLSSPAVASAPAAAVAPEPPAMTESVLPNHPGNVSYAPVMNGNVQNAIPVAPAVPAPQPWAVASGVPHPPAAQAMPPPAATQPGQPPATQGSELSQERAKQLVSQFATLASRLGISLPPTVLSSLTVAAAANEAQTAGTESLCASLPPVAPLRAPPVSILSSAPPHSASIESPKVQELEITAEAAIAAVTETHKRKEAEAPSTTSSGSKPLYSKRRKKPRLSDCEAKLAALRSDNEMLKRHLATITNKAHVFEQERQRATQEMKRMLQEEAPEKLNPLLHKFSEMYSDYGRHRHQELEFHLGQLEK